MVLGGISQGNYYNGTFQYLITLDSKISDDKTSDMFTALAGIPNVISANPQPATQTTWFTDDQRRDQSFTITEWGRTNIVGISGFTSNQTDFYNTWAAPVSYNLDAAVTFYNHYTGEYSQFRVQKYNGTSWSNIATVNSPSSHNDQPDGIGQDHIRNLTVTFTLNNGELLRTQHIMINRGSFRRATMVFTEV